MEHAHSVQDWLWPKRRRKHLTLQAEINEITIACTAPDPEQDKITCSLAREIWKSTYGRPRASQRSARADKGTVRTSKAKSLNKFLDGCRRALKEKVKHQGYRNMEAVAMSAARGVEEVWNGKMAKEMKFLANKKSEALSSCITSGVLCAGDCSPVASQAAEKRKAHAMELKAEREREAKKRRDFMSFRPIALSAGDKVFFATTVPISVRNQVLARRRVHLERCMTNASWFVVDRIGDLAQCKVGWAASLLGGFLVDSEYLLGVAAANRPRQRGVCVAFNRALTTRRRVWCSAGFKELELYTTLASCMATCGSKWAEVTAADFAKLVQKPKGMNAIALSTDAEQDTLQTITVY